MQLVVKNGTVVTPSDSRQAHVIVDEGRIVDLTEHDGDLPEAQQVLDAAGMHVLPGLVDPDVNFREPGQEYKEGWHTGSQAAVCGGVTTVLDMPNTSHPVHDRDSFTAKVEAARGTSYCDFAIKAVLTPDNADQISPLADAGACGFRFSLAGSTGAIECMSSGEILDGWHLVAETNLRCGVHPETREVVQHYSTRLRTHGRKDPAAWRAGRPPVAEVEGIARSLALAEATGIRLVFYHISATQSVDWIRRAKRDARVDLVAETNPHYCLVDDNEMDRLGSLLTMHPPVRSREHAEAVLDALADGTIDVLGTDHSPHTHEEKRYDDRLGDVWAATPGWPGLETTVGLMLTAVADGRLTIERYVACHAEGPARAWGLYPRKGVLARGSDADITVVDLDRRGTFDERTLHSKHRLSPFDGRRFTGAPAYTFVGGVLAAAHGEVATKKPTGRFVRPSASN